MAKEMRTLKRVEISGLLYDLLAERNYKGHSGYVLERILRRDREYFIQEGSTLSQPSSISLEEAQELHRDFKRDRLAA